MKTLFITKEQKQKLDDDGEVSVRLSGQSSVIVDSAGVIVGNFCNPDFKLGSQVEIQIF